MVQIQKVKRAVGLSAMLLCLIVLFHSKGASAAIVINDEQYIYYGQWNHATNNSGGYEGTPTSILWQKKPDQDGLYLSVYLLDRRSWNASGRVPAGGWHDADLFQWLNGTTSGNFYADAFTDSEKQGLKLDPDDDAGARVTLPDRFSRYGQPSRFGRTGYRYEKTGGRDTNREYWLRRGYDNDATPSTTDAWGVGTAGNEGPANVTAMHGIRPLISLNLDAFLFKTGAGTMADPYVLYRGDDRMRPESLSVSGNLLSVKLGANIAGLGGALPAAGDFALTRSDLGKQQRDAAIIGVSISPNDPTMLLLTLSEPVAYRDNLQLSYILPADSTGALTGSALVAAGERVAMAAFDHLTVRNETPPTVADIRITPADVVDTPGYRPFLAEFTVSNAKAGGSIVLNSATESAPFTGLSTTYNATARTVTISGTPEGTGSYVVNLDVTLDGTRLTGATITVNVLPSNSLADLLLTPEPPDPIVLRQDTNVVYTVSSTTPDALVRLTNVTEGANWSATGLQVAPDYGNNRFTLSGVPRQTGDYTLSVSATIDGQPKTTDLIVEIVYPNTNPQPGDIYVTADHTGPFLVGRPLRFTYTVNSSIPDAEVILEDVRVGEEWLGSGLGIEPNLAARTVTVSGTPSAAGNYSVTMDVRIDGVLLTGHMECFIVGNPPTAGDIVFVPEIPRAKAFRPFKVTTALESRTSEPLVLHDVTASVGWLDSELQFNFNAADGTVTVEGEPTEVGTYTLRLDVTIGDTRITNGSLAVRVDPAGSNPTADNIMIVPNSTTTLTVGTPADVRYQVTAGIEDANVELSNVRGGDNWDASGLRFVGDPANASFHVFGIPLAAGTYHLMMDVEIDGTLIRDYVANILVVRAPATAADLTFTPDLPAARANRQYQAVTTVGSRTGDALILNAVTGGAGWESSGLSFEVNRSDRTVRVFGTPTRVGTYALNVDATIGGTRVTGDVLTVRVEPSDSNPTSADLMVVPSTTDDFEVGRQSAITYIVTSGILDANISLQRIRPGAGWTESGLRFGTIRRTTTSAGAASASFSVYGTPATAGTYTLYLDAMVDGVLITDYELRIVVRESPITANDLIFTPAIPNAKAYRPFEATAVIGSRTGDEVILHNVTGGINWENSGMTFRYDPAAGSITVFGTPPEAGDYMLDIDATIGDTRIPNGVLLIRVDPAGTNPTAANLVAAPSTTEPLVVGKTANVRYTLSTGIQDANLSLVGLRGGPGWEESGLEFNYAAVSATGKGAVSETFTVFGVPAVAGVYTLYADVQVDGVLITNFPIEILVLEEPAVADDVTFTPRIPNAKAQRPFEATTTVGSRSGAEIVLNDVSGGAGWEASGLSYSFDTANRTITVSGTPVSAGDYTLLVDVSINGLRVLGAELSVGVDAADTPPTADNIAIIPSQLYNFVLHRPANITYQVRTGILDAVVRLLNVRSTEGWEASGLQFTFDEANRTFAVFGTPVALGSYTLLMDIQVDDTLIEDYRIDIQVVDHDPNFPDDNNDYWSGGSSGCSASPSVWAVFLPVLYVAARCGRRR